MAKLRNLVSWRPIRKVKAGAIASGVITALGFIGIQMSEETSNLLEKTVAFLVVTWGPTVAAYWTKSREDEFTR